MQKLALKRIGAYLIDFLIITLISSGIMSLAFINPHYEEYREVTTNYSSLLEDFYDEEITIEEFNSEIGEMNYEMNKYGYVYIIGDMVVILLYFGVFSFATKGQTLGKKLMGIKITSKTDAELKLPNYLLRAVIQNGIIFNIIIVIAVFLSRNTYDQIYNIASNLNTIVMIIIVMMVLFYKDGRGLHDLSAGTKVVNVNLNKEEVATEKVEVEKREEAEIIKPKKKQEKKEE